MTGETLSLSAEAINGAEEIRDPLDRVVEKIAADPGAPFAPDARERLAALKKENPAGFEAPRARLKKAGCRVTVLERGDRQRERRGGRARPNTCRYSDRTGAIGRAVSHSFRWQAVVGMVEAPRGGSAEIGGSSPCPGDCPRTSAPMRSQNAEREPVPVAAKRERPLPDARRNVTRISEGQ